MSQFEVFETMRPILQQIRYFEGRDIDGIIHPWAPAILHKILVLQDHKLWGFCLKSAGPIPHPHQPFLFPRSGCSLQGEARDVMHLPPDDHSWSLTITMSILID